MTTVKETAKALGVFNSYILMREFSAADPAVLVSYRAADNGRASQCAAWQVVQASGSSEPGGHWRDYGHKTFDVFRRPEKEPQLRAALAWASEKYGVTEWARGPYGDYHPAGTVARFKAAVKAYQKTNRDAQ